MAGIYHLNIGVGNDPHSRNSTGVIVNFWDFFFEDAASDKYFFLIKTFCLGFVDSCRLMENLVYDEIDPDDKWLSDNIEGSSRTGNSKEWANTDKTDVNDRMNKKRKNNYYALEKERAYQKSQDVHLVKDEKPRPSFIKKMKESLDKNPILVEEFSKMQKLINYNKKTQ